MYYENVKMKKTLVFLILFSCLLCDIHGQSKKIDSLIMVLGTTRENITKVNTLTSLAEEFRNNNPDTAIYFAGQALAISNKLHYQMGIANALLNRGTAKMNLGNFDKALKDLKAAIKSYDEQLVSEEGGGQTPRKLKILNQKATCYNNLGIIYANQSDYPEALKNSLTALSISEGVGDKKSIARTTGNIGLIYYSQGNYPEALKKYSEALTINKESGNKKGISLNYINIAGVYQIQGNFPEALKNSIAALKLSEEIGDKPETALGYGNIGLIYFNQGNYADALKNQLEALEIRQEIGDKQGIALSFNNIGNIYSKQGKYSQASQYLTKGLALAQEIGSIEIANESYSGLAVSDSAQGNYKEALKYYKLFVLTRDSVFSRENSKKIIQMNLQYEFDKKEVVLKAEQEKKEAIAIKEIQWEKLLRNVFIGVIGFVLVLSFLLYRVYRGRQLLRLNDIRNKIAGDLHDDIGSTLNSISIYSEVAKKNDEDHDEALEMIGDSSRRIIDAMSDIVWTINPENDSFEKIIFRMKSLAYNLFRAKKIEYTFQVDEDLNDRKLSLEERRSFYLIFKEAVNNLVKYAGATRASITLTSEKNMVRLCIRDNGIGFDTSGNNSGNGLKNMKRRAAEMNAEIKIESQPGSGTQVELKLKS